MPSPKTIPEICAALEKQGHPDLAQRIAYFASDEDLEEGDAPVTPESALGFWEFFSAVESEGKVDLACSPEGCMSAVWRFPNDERRACVWFLDSSRVAFTATDPAGTYLRVTDDQDKNSPATVMRKLVQSGLLKWYSDTMPVSTSPRPTTLRDTVAGDC